LETGFLAIFLCPLLDWRPFARRPAPRLVVWLFRWLAFRIMFGAGLIKIRGDPCWRDLTCLYYVCAASRSKRGLVEAHAPSPLAAAAVVGQSAVAAISCGLWLAAEPRGGSVGR